VTRHEWFILLAARKIAGGKEPMVAALVSRLDGTLTPQPLSQRPV
jgi:hypothetical protein